MLQRFEDERSYFLEKKEKRFYRHCNSWIENKKKTTPSFPGGLKVDLHQLEFDLVDDRGTLTPTDQRGVGAPLIMLLRLLTVHMPRLSIARIWRKR